MSINLNDNFLIYNMAIKNYYQYGKLQKKLIIAYMKCVFVFTYNSYLFSVNTWVNNDIATQIICNNDFWNTLRNIVEGADDKSVISLRTIFETGLFISAVKNLFLVHDVSFYSQDLNVLNIFQGYPFKSICNLHMSIIQSFLDQILNIICDHDLNLYSYIIIWIS
jgi:hypothetical protein